MFHCKMLSLYKENVDVLCHHESETTCRKLGQWEDKKRKGHRNNIINILINLFGSLRYIT